jgi:hypothetical protein
MTNMFPALTRTIIGVTGALFLASNFIAAAAGPAATPVHTSQVATLSA